MRIQKDDKSLADLISEGKGGGAKGKDRYDVEDAKSLDDLISEGKAGGGGKGKSHHDVSAGWHCWSHD